MKSTNIFKNKNSADILRVLKDFSSQIFHVYRICETRSDKKDLKHAIAKHKMAEFERTFLYNYLHIELENVSEK